MPSALQLSWEPPRRVICVEDGGAMNRLSGTSGESVGATSTTFLDKLKARQPDAWRRLVNLYGPLVYRWCRRPGVRAEDADDLLQEVFRSVVIHLPGFRHDRADDTFRGWLRTIAHNKVCNFLRRRAAEPKAQGGTDAGKRLSEIPDPEPDELDPGQRSEEETGLAHRALKAIQNEFEDRTWRAFCATTLEGRPGLDVAAELGMSVPAVYKAKSRVLQRLRQELVE